MSERPSIAVVGGGFGGVGAAVMLKREGYEDVTVFEKGERVGGVWQHNTYPGAACDIPSHLYEYSFAPNRWSRRYAPRVGDSGIRGRGGAALRRARQGPHRHRGEERGLGRGARQVATADQRRAARGRPPDHRLRPTLSAVGATDRGTGELRGPSLPHGRVAPRRRPCRQAGRRDRQRLQRDPGRAGDPARSSAARRLPALARMDPAEDATSSTRRGPRRSSAASPPCAGSTAPRSSPSRSSPPRP